VQLPSRAGAVRLSAFTGQFVDVTLDQRRSPENNLEDSPQVLQMPLQSRPKSTQFLSILLSLHLININCIQNYKCQEKKMNPLGKMLRPHPGKATLVQVGNQKSPVSESQYGNSEEFFPLRAGMVL